jgi:hypothetical protein
VRRGVCCLRAVSSSEMFSSSSSFFPVFCLALLNPCVLGATTYPKLQLPCFFVGRYFRMRVILCFWWRRWCRWFIVSPFFFCLCAFVRIIEVPPEDVKPIFDTRAPRLPSVFFVFYFSPCFSCAYKPAYCRTEGVSINSANSLDMIFISNLQSAHNLIFFFLLRGE